MQHKQATHSIFRHNVVRHKHFTDCSTGRKPSRGRGLNFRQTITCSRVTCKVSMNLYFGNKGHMLPKIIAESSHVHVYTYIYAYACGIVILTVAEWLSAGLRQMRHRVHTMQSMGSHFTLAQAAEPAIDKFPSQYHLISLLQPRPTCTRY